MSEPTGEPRTGIGEGERNVLPGLKSPAGAPNVGKVSSRRVGSCGMSSAFCTGFRGSGLISCTTVGIICATDVVTVDTLGTDRGGFEGGSTMLELGLLLSRTWGADSEDVHRVAEVTGHSVQLRGTSGNLCCWGEK